VPMTSKSGKPKKSELPSTVRRSGKKARRTFARAHDAAADQYGEGERAHRTAYAALKHTHERVGDHWEKKKGKGPSDAKAAGGRNSGAKTQEGVDANASKKHLMEVARRLKVPGRSTMNKSELVAGIRKANAQATRKSRS
jgi:cation transport regulator ChaB